MKKMLFALLIMGSFALFHNEAWAQKPLYRMTAAEISSLPVEEVTKRVVNGWDDMLLNINYGMRYPDEALAAFALGFQKGMAQYSNSINTNRQLTKKQQLVFKVLLELTPYCDRAGNFPEGVILFYRSKPKKDIDTVLSLKAKAIEATSTIVY